MVCYFFSFVYLIFKNFNFFDYFRNSCWRNFFSPLKFLDIFVLQFSRYQICFDRSKLFEFQGIDISQSLLITIFWVLSGPTPMNVIGISINSSIALIYFLAFRGKSSKFLIEVISSDQPLNVS